MVYRFLLGGQGWASRDGPSSRVAKISKLRNIRLSQHLMFTLCQVRPQTRLCKQQPTLNRCLIMIIVQSSQPSLITAHHHHHHIVLVARISLTLSRHSSLSFNALGRSSGQHPVSSHSCWMYVRAGRPAFARPCVGIHKSTSLMSSSLLLQQCPACLVRLTWIVFVIGGRWPYSWCLVGCCCQDLFRIARSKHAFKA